MAALNLYIDRSTQSLVKGQGNPDSAASLSFFQSNTVALTIFVMDPGALFGSAFSLVDCSTYTLRLAIGDTPTGASGGPIPLLVATSFTWNATPKTFTGTVSFALDSIASFIGSLASKVATLEISLVDSGLNRTTILQTSCTLKAVVDEGTSIATNGVSNRIRPSMPLQLQGEDGKWYSISLTTGDDGKPSLSISDSGEN